MKQSAGLLVYKISGDKLEILLTHPGGPFWAKKDNWSIPKGEVEKDETMLQTLKREFLEEVGIEPPLDHMIELGEAPASGKINHIWAVAADVDLSKFHCDSMVHIQWPPRSGTVIAFPENDKAAWFTIDVAKRKIFKSQLVFIERLADLHDIKLNENLDSPKPSNQTLF
jgi:predicted NUDIX family NTP pyrophosphohydrolase